MQGIGRVSGARAVFDMDGGTATLAIHAHEIAVKGESGRGAMNVNFARAHPTFCPQ